MLNRDIVINSDFITLAQLLKFANIIESGGHAKDFLTKNSILVNGLTEHRRGRKLVAGDQIVINNKLYLTLKQK